MTGAAAEFGRWGGRSSAEMKAFDTADAGSSTSGPGDNSSRSRRDHDAVRNTHNITAVTLNQGHRGGVRRCLTMGWWQLFMNGNPTFSPTPSEFRRGKVARA